MKVLTLKIFGIFWFLFFCFACFGNDRLHAASENIQIWPIDIENQRMLDILQQMSKVFGVEILIDPKNTNKLIGGSFQGFTVDQMLEKLLQHENHALVWRYEADRLKAVEIWIFNGKGKTHHVKNKETNNTFQPAFKNEAMNENTSLLKMLEKFPIPKKNTELEPPPMPTGLGK